MKFSAKRLCPLLLALLLLLGACAPGAFAKPTPVAFTPAPVLAMAAFPAVAPRLTSGPTPEPLPTPDGHDLTASRAQEWVVTKWAIEDSPGFDPENMPGDVPDSIKRMLPLVECVLLWRTYYYDYYDTYTNPDRYRGRITDNLHDINNEAYLWYTIENMVGFLGDSHPEAIVTQNPWNIYEPPSIRLPESAVRDFSEICFADYTPDFQLPTAPPETWRAEPDMFYTIITYEDGWYTCWQGGGGNRERFIITYYTTDYARSKPNDDHYHMTILHPCGLECFGTVVYLVELAPYSQPNAFDAEWRISRIYSVNPQANQTDSGEEGAEPLPGEAQP